MAVDSNYMVQVLKVEPYGIEPIPLSERHGNTSQLFTFWFSTNLNILTWFTGALGIILGLSFIESTAAILLGNLLGTVFLAITSSQGPRHGLPQIAASGQVFGKIGLKIFGTVNWLSNVGWFAVDIVLGVVALQQIMHISYPLGLVILGCVTILVAVIGYNFIHRFAQISAIILGIFFLIMTIRMIPQINLTTLWAKSHLTVAEGLPLFVLATGAVFAYQIAFCTVSSDYSRYLHPKTSGKRIALFTFLGSTLAGIG